MRARENALYGLLLMVTGTSLAASDPLTIKTSPQVAFAPAQISVRATVERDDKNRALEVVIDSEDFYRSSLVQLDGDQAPRTSVIEFQSVPEGQYVVQATVFDQAGKPRNLTRQVMNDLGDAEPAVPMITIK